MKDPLYKQFEIKEASEKDWEKLNSQSFTYTKATNPPSSYLAYLLLSVTIHMPSFFCS